MWVDGFVAFLRSIIAVLPSHARTSAPTPNASSRVKWVRISGSSVFIALV